MRCAMLCCEKNRANLKWICAHQTLFEKEKKSSEKRIFFLELCRKHVALISMIRTNTSQGVFYRASFWSFVLLQVFQKVFRDRLADLLIDSSVSRSGF